MKIKTDLDLPLLLLLLGAILGLGVAYDRSLSIPIFRTVVISWLVYAVLARLSSASVRCVAWALLGLWTLAAWYLITQYGHLGYPAKIGLVHRLGQSTGAPWPNLRLFRPQPNAMATFLEGGVPVGMALLLFDKRAWKRMAALVAVVSLSYALLLTASRGAWSGLVCAGLSTGIWSARRRLPGRAWMALVAGAGLLCLVGAGLVIAVGPDWIPGLRAALEYAADRLALQARMFNLVKDFALTGIGLGDTFGLVYSRYVLLIRVPFFTYAHSLLLAVWLGHGLVGVLGFGWLLIAFARLIGRGLRQGASPLFWGAALGVVVSLLHGVVDATQYEGVGWPMLPLYALLGLVAATAPKRLAPRRWLRLSWPRLSLFGVLALLLGVLTWPALSSIYQINRGSLDQARADLAPDLSELERTRLRDEAAARYRLALQLWPGQTISHRRLGLLALDANEFEAAISHLERAYEGNPSHPANVKGLGLAYLWAGRLDQAEVLLQDVPWICEELNTWAWWRGTQGQDDLAAYARLLAERICARRAGLRASLPDVTRVALAFRAVGITGSPLRR